jgi:DEAD/DEAH box helicase domain-containing protein
MELGVDIGTLDAVVMNGYPGTISSLRQQSGRAGRGTRDGIAILVAKNDPLDQYYMRHAALLLGGKAESVRVHPANPFILAQQLQCATYERPLAPTELDLFPPDSLEVLESMEDAGLVTRRAGMWHSTSQASPAAGIDIRGSGGESFVLQAPWGELGTMEKWRAFQSAHEGAVYLHRGEQFIVSNLNLESKYAELQPADVNYYTQPISETFVESVAEIAGGSLGRMQLRFQGLRVTTTVTGYKRKSLLDDTIVGIEDLDLPPNTIQTVGVRIDLPSDPDDPIWEDGVHALEHLMVALGPTIAQCEPRDLGSTYYAMWPETLKPAIFVFDAVPGGIGLSQALFERAPEWFAAVREQLESCPCTAGCPSCILSPRCPYSNENVD